MKIAILALAVSALTGCVAISTPPASVPGSSPSLPTTESSKADSEIAARLIKSLEKSDYEVFLADGEPAFRQLKKEQFEALTSKLAPHFRSGYEVSYFGTLKHRDYHVSLWKISFKDGSDDVLATLSVREGKVGGFILR